MCLGCRKQAGGGDQRNHEREEEKPRKAPFASRLQGLPVRAAHRVELWGYGHRFIVVTLTADVHRRPTWLIARVIRRLIGFRVPLPFVDPSATSSETVPGRRSLASCS